MESLLSSQDASAVVKEGRPPHLSTKKVSEIIKKYFNFKEVNELSVKSFPSYRDRTYYFQGENPDESNYEFVFKLSNPLSTSFDVMKGVNEVMKHLNSHSLLSPYPLASHTGAELVELSSAELLSNSDHTQSDQKKMKYPVFVLSFIPGEIFDHVDKAILTPALLSEVGELLGKIDKELMVWTLIGLPVVKRGCSLYRIIRHSVHSKVQLLYSLYKMLYSSVRCSGSFN